MAKLDERGREILDQTPMAVPFHFDRPQSIHLRLRQQILDFVAEQRKNEEVESLEDFNDFEIEGEPDSYDDARSPYEEDGLTGMIAMEEQAQALQKLNESQEKAFYEKLKAKYEGAPVSEAPLCEPAAQPAQPEPDTTKPHAARTEA